MKKLDFKARTLDIPEDVVKKARRLFSYETALDFMFKKLVSETAETHEKTREAWNEVYAIALEQGIVKDKQEKISYSWITGKFEIIPKEDND